MIKNNSDKKRANKLSLGSMLCSSKFLSLYFRRSYIFVIYYWSVIIYYNYIKRTCAGNEDVTFTIHIPCKQLKDIHDKKINIFSGYSYAFKTAGHQMAQCHEFLAMLYVFFCNASWC